MAPRDDGGSGGGPPPTRSNGGSEDWVLHLHQTYGQKVYAFFLRRGFGVQDSRDLTQETFLRVLRTKGGRLRSEASAPSWILRVAVNVWKNELRRRGSGMRSAREVSLEVEMEHGEPRLREGLRLGSAPPPNPLETTLRREEVALTREVLRSMPPQRRRCLLLLGQRQLQYAEIAELLGLSQETVKKHIQLGRRQLREELARRFAHGQGP